MYVQHPTSCPNCGAPLQPGQAHCHNCGAPAQPVPAPGYYRQPGMPSQQWLANDAFASGPGGKSRGVAALLAILLGGLGIQYFYCGKVAAGIITIVLSLVTCGIWNILTLVQGIMMFCMTNREFETKYVDNSATFPLF